MSRLPKLSPDEMTPAQAEVHASITSGPRGVVQGPFTALIHSPELTDPVQQLGAYLRYNSRIPERQRELVICTVGATWQADFEWYAHAPLAIKAGIPATAMDQIAKGETPDLSDPRDQLAFRFATELITTKRISETTYADAITAFGAAGVVDLTGLIGYYTLLAMTLNTFEVDVPEGSDIPWAKV